MWLFLFAGELFTDLIRLGAENYYRPTVEYNTVQYNNRVKNAYGTAFTL